MFNLLQFGSFIQSLTSTIRTRYIGKLLYKKDQHRSETGRDLNIRNDHFKNRACIKTRLSSDSGLIIIKNTGQSGAKNVRILLDGIPVNNYPGIFNKKRCYVIPSNSTIALQACVKTDLFPSEFIEIIWDDKEAENNTYRVLLYD